MSDNIGIKVGIDGEKEFNRAIREINTSLRTSKTEMDAVSSAYDKNDKSVEKLTKENETLNKTLERLRSEQQKAAEAIEYANKQFGESSVKSQQAQQAYNKVTTEINTLERQLSSNNELLENHGEELDDNAEAVDTLAAALAAAGVVGGLKAIANALRVCIDASVEFESAMAGVYKTVDGTDEQLQAISGGIKELSTVIPASTTELAGIAEAAGQLGIATDDILGFTEVMAKLGTSTNMSAEDAATALARFANITGTSADNYERLGSTIVALGNNFATTESEITQLATRLASAGTIAGLTESDILALSAAMSSVGINAEAGGTAMTQTLTAMEKAIVSGGDKLESFAKISGMSVSEFKQAWDTSAITAVQAFISGLGDLEAQGESATLILDDLELSGVRQANMLKSLALASNELTSAIGLSSAAWEENTALAAEAALRYETTESKFQLLENSTTLLKQAIGDALTPALAEAAEKVATLAQWAADFVAANEDVVKGITALIVGLGGFAGAAVGIAAVTQAIKALKSMLLTTISPVGAIAAATVGFIAALVALQAAFPAAESEGSRLKETMKDLEAEVESTKESLASAKINEQIASAQADRAALVTQLAIEAQAAISSSHAFIDLATAKTMAMASDSAEMKAYDAQITALEKLRDNLGKTTVAKVSSASASKKVATAEEESAKAALTAFKAYKTELDHLKATDIIKEADYYKKLTTLRDEYLTDDANLDEYRKTTEQIYKYQADMLDNTLEAYEGHLANVAEDFQNSLNEIEAAMQQLEQQQKAMTEKLANYGDLFSWAKDTDGEENLMVNSLEEQIEALQDYANLLDQLEAAGVSAGLMSEIALLDVDDALAYGDELLKMGDALDDYVAAYDKKQALAAEIAEKYYDDQIAALESDYNAMLDTALATLQDTAFISGEDTIGSLIDGMSGMEADLYSKIDAIVKNANSLFTQGLNIDASAAYAAVNNTPDFGASLSASAQQQSAEDITNGIVNGLSAVLAAQGNNVGMGEIVLNINGTELARATIDDYRAVEESSPAIRNDF